jgi:hypothetical protein
MNTITQEYLEQLKTGGATSSRAKAMATRIEEGAATLASFAEQLSEAEWSTPALEGGKPGRSVGVIVHHVASVYPIEVELARAIAAGRAVTDVTWDVVAELNAKHAAHSVWRASHSAVRDRGSCLTAQLASPGAATQDAGSITLERDTQPRRVISQTVARW